jgi:hypothetical protein
MTTRKATAKAKANAGSLRCSAHGETVNSFGRDDYFLCRTKYNGTVETRATAVAATAGPTTAGPTTADLLRG